MLFIILNLQRVGNQITIISLGLKKLLHFIAMTRENEYSSRFVFFHQIRHSLKEVR
jgi:hypothetical protein